MSSFQLIRTQFIPSLGITYEEYHHSNGSKHIHLRNPSGEHSFMISCPTFPMAHDGRAHILEHLSLEGSQNYQTRSPFFSMHPRSISSFMNAFTYPDKTVYPFVTQDPQDFENLLSVYLDCVFFPKLDELGFLQEGWRLEFNGEDRLQYSGVVYNEMKGLSNDSSRLIYKELMKQMNPGTTYAYDSGGIPEFIPDLSLDELKQFHHEHYHPSRATFWSSGPMDPQILQKTIETKVFSQFSDQFDRLNTPPPPKSLPVTHIRHHVPTSPQGNPNQEHEILLSWSIGDAKDQTLMNEWTTLSSAIFDNSSCFMVKAIESSGLGRPSFSQVVTAGRHAFFTIGLKGLSESQIPIAKKLLLDSIRQVAKDGVPQSVLEHTLNNIEIQQKEINSQSMPYSLKWMLSMVDAELMGSDPITHLDIDADILHCRVRIQDPNFSKSLLSIVYQDPCELVSIPDVNFVDELQLKESEKLRRIQDSLTSDEITKIRYNQRRLLESQTQIQDPSQCDLPQIHPHQISSKPYPSLNVNHQALDQGPSFTTIQGPTNGLDYLTLSCDLSHVEPADVPWIRLATQLMMDLGFGFLPFDQADAFRNSQCAGIQASFSLKPIATKINEESNLHCAFNLSLKGLTSNRSNMIDLLIQQFKHPRFDEQDRIAYLIQRRLDRILQKIPQIGDQIAHDILEHSFNPASQFESSDPFYSLKWLQDLAHSIKTPEGLNQVCEKIQQVMVSSFAKAPISFSIFSSQALSDLESDVLRSEFLDHPPIEKLTSQSHSLHVLTSQGTSQAVIGPGMVNYCYEAFQVPKQTDPDAEYFSVLSRYLSSHLMHPLIREQGGAYGGSAHYNGFLGMFTLSSYRDPRVLGTFTDFKTVIETILHKPLDPQALQEAIVSSLRSPSIAAQEHAQLSLSRVSMGLSEADLESKRLRILQCTESDLKRIAKQYLDNAPSQRSAYITSDKISEAQQLEMTINTLQDLVSSTVNSSTIKP